VSTAAAAVQQTAAAAPGQLASVVTDQQAQKQQVTSVQATAVAVQQTVDAQQKQLQALTANQTVTAQQVAKQAAPETQLAAIQATAQAEGQGLAALQTAVANLTNPRPTSTPRQDPAAVATPAANAAQPSATKLLYSWFYKSPSEPPRLCGVNQGNPCIDSAPNQGAQYISGHVLDQHGQPVQGIIIHARSGSSPPLYNSTDASGYYSILLYKTCPPGPQSWDVYVVDDNNSLSSYVKNFTYVNCAQAGEFHIDFVQAS
jgi:hypothetical protein